MAEIRPNLERIKQLTAQNLANKNAANQQNYISSPKPTVSFNPQVPDTITPMDANLPTTPTKIEPTAPTGTFDPFATKTVDTSTPEGMLEAGAIDKRGAVNELIKKFSTTATESSYDMYKRMREEEGLGKLIEGRNDVFKTVQTTMDAIDQLEETIANEGAEIGTLTKAQLGNITGREGKELTRRLNTANNLLQSYNLSIGDVESKIDKFMQFDRQDKADELERLVNLANYAGLTQDEKDILAFEIDKKLKADEKEEASLEQKQDTLDSGITALREMATGAGVITGKFAEVAAEAQRRLDAGEDPQAILADVSAAVLNNPTLQRQFEIERIKAEQSIVARSSGGGGGASGLSSNIASLVALTGVAGQEDYLQSQLDKLSPDEMVQYISALSGDTGGGTDTGSLFSLADQEIDRANSVADLEALKSDVIASVNAKEITSSEANALNVKINEKLEQLKKQKKTSGTSLPLKSYKKGETFPLGKINA